jgi:hypothetical protein
VRMTKNQFDPSSTSPEFRAEIDAITRRYDPDKVRGQLLDMTQLARRFPHSIEVVQAFNRAERGPRQFNCYMYALDIHNSPSIAKLLEHPGLPLGNDFMQWLVESRRLKPTAATLKNDDIILYSNVEGVQHAGRWNGERVVSKWGLAHLWKHGIFEIPTRYGQVARSYRGVKRALAEKWYQEFVE